MCVVLGIARAMDNETRGFLSTAKRGMLVEEIHLPMTKRLLDREDGRDSMRLEN